MYWKMGPQAGTPTYFDIDWNTTELALQNKMLVPILGDHYGRVLARHEVQITAGTVPSSL